MILTLIRFLYNRQTVLRGISAGLVTFIMGIPAGQAAETQTRNDCESQRVSNATQLQFEQLKQKLESGYAQGLPHQLQEELLGIREINDKLSMRLMDSKSAKVQELQEVLKMTIAHIEKFVAVIPKLAEQAPKVRDQYVLPLSNLEPVSLKCHTESLTYQTVFKEIQRINSDLYSVQRLTPQKYINFQEDLQNLLNASLNDKNTKIAQEFQKKLPEVIHSLQTEVDRALPSFQLSAQYRSSGTY